MDEQSAQIDELLNYSKQTTEKRIRMLSKIY